MAAKLHFSITIDAPVEKVWDTMLNDTTYIEWTKAFSPDGSASSFQGNWEKGTQMRFIGVDENGDESGMISEIADNRPYEFLSIHHIGMIDKGVEKTDPEITAGWGDALENYTFKKLSDNQTEVLVDVDVEDSYKDYFEDAWPKALERLKELSEK